MKSEVLQGIRVRALLPRRNMDTIGTDTEQTHKKLQYGGSGDKYAD